MSHSPTVVPSQPYGSSISPSFYRYFKTWITHSTVHVYTQAHSSSWSCRSCVCCSRTAACLTQLSPDSGVLRVSQPTFSHLPHSSLLWTHAAKWLTRHNRMCGEQCVMISHHYSVRNSPIYFSFKIKMTKDKNINKPHTTTPINKKTMHKLISTKIKQERISIRNHLKGNSNDEDNIQRKKLNKMNK